MTVTRVTILINSKKGDMKMSTFIDSFGDEREFTAEEAYTVYYNAISKHGCNNNAAAAADKRGFNWTCDFGDEWHKARIELTSSIYEQGEY